MHKDSLWREPPDTELTYNHSRTATWWGWVAKSEWSILLPVHPRQKIRVQFHQRNNNGQ